MTIPTIDVIAPPGADPREVSEKLAAKLPKATENTGAFPAPELVQQAD